jgi:cytochrome P450
MRAVDEFNPLSPQTTESPWEWYEALREQAPIHREPLTGMFMVSRFDDVTELLTNTNDYSAMSGPAVGDVPAEVREIVRNGVPNVDTLLTADPPEHIRYRSLVSRAFAPRRVARLEPDIRAVAEPLIEAMLPRGRAELVAEFAVPLPLTIIADQLGVPRVDMPSFKKWSDDAVAPLGGLITLERRVECARSDMEFQAYFLDMLEQRRRDPRDDMLSQVVHAKLEGVQPLDDAECISILRQFLVAGNETTTNAIASAAMLLLQNPDELARLRAEPDLIGNAAEEVLRLESPVQILFRSAKRDLELHDVKVPAGARLAAMYAAANRDPRKFADPERFDVGRANAREHLALGHGEHFCVGAGLARKELTIAIEALVTRFPNLRLPEAGNDFSHHPSLILRGLRELRVEFDARN